MEKNFNSICLVSTSNKCSNNAQMDCRPLPKPRSKIQCYPESTRSIGCLNDGSSTQEEDTFISPIATVSK